jgi:hypothetical protein
MTQVRTLYVPPEQNVTIDEHLSVEPSSLQQVRTQGTRERVFSALLPVALFLPDCASPNMHG